MTRAAKRLNIVQPAISIQIAKLEAEFGRPLFVRASKGMMPTEAAHDAYRLFLPLIREMLTVKQSIIGATDEVKGHVRFGIVSAVSSNRKSNSIITNATAELLSLYPSVTIKMTNDYTQELIDSVRTDQLDFAIVNTTVDGLQMPFEPILQENLVLVSSRKNSIRAPKVVGLHEIDSTRLVLPSKRHDLRTVINQVAESIGIRFEPRVEFDKISFIINFLQNDNWISILPPTAVHAGLHDRTLRAASIINPPIPRQLICIQSPHRSLSTAARKLIDQITSKLQSALNDSKHLTG
jgi:DNA-binding transcriptional LysR family regulator